MRFICYFTVPVGNDFQLGVDASSGNIGLYRSNDSIPYPFDIGLISITGSNAGNQYYYYYYNIEIMPYANFEEVYVCDGDSVAFKFIFFFETSADSAPMPTLALLPLIGKIQK